MLVDQVPGRRVSRFAATVPGVVHGLHVEGHLGVVGETGKVSSKEAVSRFAIGVGSIVEELNLARGVIARGVVERPDGVNAIEIACPRENGDPLPGGRDRRLVDHLAQHRSEIIRDYAVCLSRAAEVVRDLQPVSVLAPGVLPVAAEVQHMRAAQPAGLQADLVGTGGHSRRGLCLDSVDPGVAIAGSDNLEAGVARCCVFGRSA